ncbi:DUF2510 domain-containing protein [Leucobacter sp. wl10]|nr:DUF2510 domain-containing protein [Leucobacter sp. wl10]
MSIPAGWYDDGSGHRRWWDGQQWTNDYAPVQGGVIPAQPAPGADSDTAAPVISTPAAGRVSPVLGLVGLGLAVLGTILACIPAVFGVGAVLLLAGFVVSLVGLFTKNTAKWPSIVGMILSVVGGVIGSIVLAIVLAANLAGPVLPTAPTDAPPSTTEQPSDTPTSDPSETRPSPEEIAEGYAEMLLAGGITTYEDMPDFYPCVGQQLYDSDLSDEALRLISTGQDPPDSEYDAASQILQDVVFTCDPNGRGVS